ncbi:MAG: hypothetical protein H6672_09165 [Anaerolineaceae bacterium]|nr:hypothetical protein [Anaerolineaceae bacterium]
MAIQDECYLIFGGAGLVGRQIAREIAFHLNPRKIVIAGLFQREVEEALDDLRTMYDEHPIEWVGAWGNIFVREEYAHDSRAKLLENDARREELYADLFGNMDEAYERSHLVALIREHRPDVIIDSINTATAISYQDVYTASVVAKREVDRQLEAVRGGDMNAAQNGAEDTNYNFDLLVLSQSLPQLVRHTQILHRVMCEVDTRMYLKIGTTGTGGMGLNIPYTHSEDRPSSKLMTKTAVAFAHTGLMFLMARTPTGPIVKEIKPGGMIGYADVSHQPIKEHGQPAYIFTNRVESLGDRLTLREAETAYERLSPLELPVVNTGENGFFARGEFEAITALRQMEFITPEEIARDAVLEIRGSNTGFDVIAAIDSSVMNPTYRAGYLRQQVLLELDKLEQETETHSVALGQLGPPELLKLLWEAELLRIEYGTLDAVLAQQPAAISAQLESFLEQNIKLCNTMTSIGVPILLPDGKRLLRGPRIRIPEIPGVTEVPLEQAEMDRWAAKGWVDLRSPNFAIWQHRFETIVEFRSRYRGRGSAAVSRQVYLYDDIRIGELVGWIFNNEQVGYRIK